MPFDHSEGPVTFKVLHGADREIIGASLMSVGDWSSERFATNDRLLEVAVSLESRKDRDRRRVVEQSERLFRSQLKTGF